MMAPNIDFSGVIWKICQNYPCFTLSGSLIYLHKLLLCVLSFREESLENLFTCSSQFSVCPMYNNPIRLLENLNFQ